MRGSSPIKLTALNAEQIVQLELCRARWQGLQVSTQPADRTAAEAGVVAAYRAAGCPAPREIVWCDSPIAIARDRRAVSGRGGAGANLRLAVIDSVKQRVAAAVDSLIGDAAKAAMVKVAKAGFAKSLGIAVMDAVHAGVRASGPQWGARLGAAVQALVNRPGRAMNWVPFAWSGVSQHDMGWLSRYAFLRDVADLRRQTGMLQGLCWLGENVGWMVPHADVCWLSERHSVLNYDDAGRLHCAEGPAVGYRDGWSAYAWKGVLLPAAFIEERDGITLKAIDRQHDRVLRRCMIEIMTPEHFIAAGGARCVSRDETGMLWLKTWYDGDAWAAVEVVNGSLGKDGRREHYFLQVPPQRYTARSAVAWTYGLSEAQYRNVVQRT